MFGLGDMTYIVYECPHCKGRLSIPVDTPVIRFEYCPVCKERIDKRTSSYLEALIEIAKSDTPEIKLEFKQCS